MPELSIIIVNYNTTELTKQCIQNIKCSSFSNFEIIVVDNNSQDNSLAKIKAEYPEIIAIQNESNDGFGRANNLGAKHSKGEYLLFLNSDVFVNQNTLELCISEITNKKEIGVLTCQLLNEDGSYQRTVFYDSGTLMATLKENLLIDKLITFKQDEIRAVIGAFMIIPNKIFTEVNGFDNDFFMYSEELELCDRIRSARYKIVKLSSSKATHIHGGSTTNKIWSLVQKNVSSQLYYRKKRGPFGLVWVHLIKVFNYATNFFLMWLLDKNYRKNLGISFKYYLKSFKYFPSILFYSFRKTKGFLKVEK